LADLILLQGDAIPEAAAESFLNEKITSVDQALQGARDIIAEIINEDTTVRDKLRRLFREQAAIISKIDAEKEQEAAKYRDYLIFQKKSAAFLHIAHWPCSVVFLKGFCAFQ
jgi:uncharacterized protein